MVLPYLTGLLKANGFWTLHNPGSNIVVFRKPQSVELIRKWSLATTGDLAQVVIMQHMTMDMLTKFAAELASKEEGSVVINKAHRMVEG